MSQYHEAVLLREAVEGLDIIEKPNGVFVDATFGGGGHSKAILAQLGDTGHLFGFDQDIDALANTQYITDERFTFIQQNFRHLKRFLRLHGITKVDGILADLGISWHQINTPKRGFSTRFDDDQLDMRMNQNASISAQDVRNQYPPTKLQFLFSSYGQLPNAKRLSIAIAAERRKQAIKTVGQLKDVALPFVKGLEHKYYAQLFQALRIEINQELEALKDLLLQSKEILHPKGRLVIIAYHSVEDKLVKNFIKKGNFEGKQEKDFYGNILNKAFLPINKKVIVPTPLEIKQNNKARSAKMRIAEKL